MTRPPTADRSDSAGGQSREPRATRERWNRRHAQIGAHLFPQPPAAWLTENRTTLLTTSGCLALDIACGDGRNSAYLAQLGFEVDALDISDVAIDKLRAAATDHGLAVNAIRLDLEHEPLPRSDYDVIVQFNYLQRNLFGSLAQALAPGGILIAETVTRAHAEELGNDFDRRYLLDAGELLAAFPDLDVLRYREGIVQRAGAPRAVASLVARRRATARG